MRHKVLSGEAFCGDHGLHTAPSSQLPGSKGAAVKLRRGRGGGDRRLLRSRLSER